MSVTKCNDCQFCIQQTYSQELKVKGVNPNSTIKTNHFCTLMNTQPPYNVRTCSDFELSSKHKNPDEKYS